MKRTNLRRATGISIVLLGVISALFFITPKLDANEVSFHQKLFFNMGFIMNEYSVNSHSLTYRTTLQNNLQVLADTTNAELSETLREVADHRSDKPGERFDFGRKRTKKVLRLLKGTDYAKEFSYGTSVSELRVVYHVSKGDIQTYLVYFKALLKYTKDTNNPSSKYLASIIQEAEEKTITANHLENMVLFILRVYSFDEDEKSGPE